MKTHEIWKRGWLKDKQMIYNTEHQLFNPVIDNIIKDMRKGLNRIILVVGTPRSGKSWGSVWFQCFFNWCYYGREEYKPAKNNLNPLKDIYWKIDDFINATKDPDNWSKFITLEEQGVENYKMDFWKKESQSQDKLLQIFGIDDTNLIINLPYIFDLSKGTRMKGHYLMKFLRKGKKRVDVIFCKRWMSDTTEKARFTRKFVWNKFPNIYDIYPNLLDEYELLKRKYNKEKKDELTKKEIKKEDIQPKIFGKI